MQWYISVKFLSVSAHKFTNISAESFADKKQNPLTKQELEGA